MNEGFIAMLGYYIMIATTLSAKSTDAEKAQQPHYLEQVGLYKALDGQKSRRDWRTLLLDLVQKWLCRFQNVQARGMQARGRSGFSLGPTTPTCRASAVPVNIAPGGRLFLDEQT